MEIHLTANEEAQLAQAAAQAGVNPERLAADVVARYLDEKARFLAAVEKGIAAAERGEFVEEEEMDARLEAMFQVGCRFALSAFRRANRANNLSAHSLFESTSA